MNLNGNEQSYLQEKIGLARAAFTQGDETKALAYLQEARITLTSCAAVEIAVAHVFEDFGNLILARAYFQEALYKEPDNAEAQICLELVELQLAGKSLRVVRPTEQPTLFEEYS